MEKDEFIRDIVYYKNYYLDFFNTLNPKVRLKFNWTLKLIATVDKIPSKFFRHITSSTGIFEIRVEVGSDIYRVFSFFDKGNLIVLINAFQQKTQKTPKQEIELAEKLKKEYFTEKSKNEES